MSIEEQLTLLASTKEGIKAALISKGATITGATAFAEYPAKIAAIEGGGGTPEKLIGITVEPPMPGLSISVLVTNIVSQATFDFGVFDAGGGFTWTAGGGAVISTDVKKFGAGSVTLGGGKSLSRAADQFTFSGGYSLDFWMYRDFVPFTFHSIVDFRAQDTNAFPAIGINSAGTLYTYGLGGTGMQDAGVTPFREWFHVYLGGEGSVSYLGLNGTVYTGTQGNISAAASIYLGFCPFNSGFNAGHMYMDNFRYRVGPAVWKSNFTPPGENFS